MALPVSHHIAAEALVSLQILRNREDTDRRIHLVGGCASAGEVIRIASRGALPAPVHIPGQAPADRITIPDRKALRFRADGEGILCVSLPLRAADPKSRGDERRHICVRSSCDSKIRVGRVSCRVHG